MAIRTNRTLCPGLEQQVGHSWQIWVKMQTTDANVKIFISETSLDNPSPLDDPPAVFEGTRSGNTVTASRAAVNLGGMACPSDGRITPQTGGALTATIVGAEMSGEYTDVFGTGGDQVTFVFTFRATLAGIEGS